MAEIKPINEAQFGAVLTKLNELIVAVNSLSVNEINVAKNYESLMKSINPKKRK